MGDMDVWLNALEYQSLYLSMLLGMVNKGPCKKDKGEMRIGLLSCSGSPSSLPLSNTPGTNHILHDSCLPGGRLPEVRILMVRQQPCSKEPSSVCSSVCESNLYVSKDCALFPTNRDNCFKYRRKFNY